MIQESPEFFRRHVRGEMLVEDIKYFETKESCVHSKAISVEIIRGRWLERVKFDIRKKEERFSCCG